MAEGGGASSEGSAAATAVLLAGDAADGPKAVSGAWTGAPEAASAAVREARGHVRQAIRTIALDGATGPAGGIGT